MKKKQICFCMTSGVSLETWSQKGLLSRELSTLNNIASSVIILSYGEKKIEKNIISSNDNLSVISLPRPPRFISPRIYTPLAVLFNSKLLDPCRDVDLVMSNQMDGSLVALVVALILKKNFILRTGYSLIDFTKKLKKSSFEILGVSIYSLLCIFFSNKYIVSSKSEYISLSYLPRRLHRRIRVIPNWIDTNTFAPIPSSLRMNSLVSVGRIDHQKNPIDMVLIAHYLRRDLTLIGSGALSQIVQKVADDLSVNLTIIDNIDNSQLPTLLSHYEFYLTCSRFEGCPKSVLEAMSCGLCVLAYDSPGINDIVINKSNGLLLRPNPSIASQQIREFINDKPLIARIKKNATQTIIEDFSAQSVFNKYELEFND